MPKASPKVNRPWPASETGTNYGLFTWKIWRARRDSNARPPPHLDPCWISFERVFAVLTLFVAAGKSTGFIATVSGLSPAAVESIIAAAIRWGPAIGLRVEDGRLVECPSRPRGTVALAFFQRLEARLAGLAARAPDLYAEV